MNIPFYLEGGLSDVVRALILGIIQGLTEYLPVSSSGHLEIGEVILGFGDTEDLVFPILVHAATALSSVIIFRKEILDIFKGLLEFKWNESTEYTVKILLSSIPVVIIGLFFQDTIKGLFDQKLVMVGGALIVTGILLLFTYWAKPKERSVNYKDSIIIGIVQAIAVIPGISRSGATIATSLMLGVDKAKAAQFSFLMVIVPILGKATLDAKDWVKFWLFPSAEDLAAQAGSETLSATALTVGFIAAFLTGLVACKAMLSIVQKGKLYYFSIYCAVVGILAIIFG